MDASSQPPAPSTAQPSTPPRLRLDFQWRKWRTYISNENEKDKPRYTLHYKLLAPQLRFRNNVNNEIIGNGILHFFSIDADWDLYGRQDIMVAQKRWKCIYSFRSMALSTDGQPVTLNWVSESGFKTWDFVCVDPNQMPLARFTANTFGLKHLATIEFTGPVANSQLFQEEIMVTGVTLAYCAAVRFSSLSGVVNSLASDPGHDKKYPPASLPPPQPQGPDYGQYEAYGQSAAPVAPAGASSSVDASAEPRAAPAKGQTTADGELRERHTSEAHA
ncbi:hypothetical protein N7492_004564 [Penicillium capsulatum]|uniref:Uncharacterized protein n=1 Tax=Penicillium capsulatum TaxID=69766 RepID=A0A9W9LQV5_9EURO|nr:hypothetical protein N7492_004564 [Penicillium capsulatum]KAJ6136318.1 hypothetical protein N7512_001478 [Penicillium capsulatum]